MRKLIYAINTSIDGCCDHTKMIPSEDVFDFFIQLIRGADLLVYGRITYELMIPYWPDIAKNNSGDSNDNAFAHAFDSKKKVVFSRTLESVEDKNSRLVRTDLRTEILKLKQEEGADLLLGGVDLPSQLIDLIDEYYFVVAPIIVGEGRRLFEGSHPRKRLELKLIDYQAYKSGTVVQHYKI